MNTSFFHHIFTFRFSKMYGIWNICSASTVKWTYQNVHDASRRLRRVWTSTKTKILRGTSICLFPWRSDIVIQVPTSHRDIKGFVSWALLSLITFPFGVCQKPDGRTSYVSLLCSKIKDMYDSCPLVLFPRPKIIFTRLKCSLLLHIPKSKIYTSNSHVSRRRSNSHNSVLCSKSVNFRSGNSFFLRPFQTFQKCESTRWCFPGVEVFDSARRWMLRFSAAHINLLRP